MNCASWASTASSLEVKEVTSAEAHSCRWTAPSDQTSRSPGRDLFGRDETAADRRRAAFRPDADLLHVVRPSDREGLLRETIRSRLSTRCRLTMRRRLLGPLYDEAVASISARLQGALPGPSNSPPGAERSHRTLRFP